MVAKGTSKSAGKTLECLEAAGEYRRIRARAISGGATSTGDPDQSSVSAAGFKAQGSGEMVVYAVTLEGESNQLRYTYLK